LQVNAYYIIDMIYDMICYDMIYYIYFLQLVFHPVAAVGKLYKNWKEIVIYKEKQYIKQKKHRIHNIENKHTKQEQRHKKNIKTR